MLFKKKHAHISSPESFFGMLSVGGCVNCDHMILEEQAQWKKTNTLLTMKKSEECAYTALSAPKKIFNKKSFHLSPFKSCLCHFLSPVPVQ